MTLGDFLTTEDGFVPELIICSLSQGFHWLRITSGHTPTQFSKLIDFKLNGYDHIYKGASAKDEIIAVFNGVVKTVPFAAQ